MKKKPSKKPAKKKRAPSIKHEIQTEYLSKVYSKQFVELVPKVAKTLRAIKRKLKFDAIAFRGSSGAALAFPMSYLLKIPLIHVRKGASHYTGGPIEGTISSQKYLIIDDFIDRGNTVRTIIKTIKKEMNAKPVAICLYSAGKYSKRARYEGVPIFSV